MSENLNNTNNSFALNSHGYALPGNQPKPFDATTVADYILTVVLLVLSSPVLLLSVAWVTIVDFGNPFFIQHRVGLNGKSFEIIKLRTMEQNPGENVTEFCKKGDKRIIFGGHFLRKSRIDEIPQFLNVLLGDMALVGPRPEQARFVSEFKESIKDYDLRHLHKPGITGLAQIRQGYVDDCSGTKKKLKYDLLYIKKRNFKTWLYVVTKTVEVVIRRVGR